MFLNKIYSEPEVFEPVEFKRGINYIFGKKEISTQEEVKNSLNGIGKSTLLDLIDFALLSNYNKRDSKRLYAAYQKGILKEVTIILDFEVDEAQYSIRRSFDKPNTIFISIDDNVYEEYPIKNIKPRLCDIIFKRNYVGHYSDKWLRRLLPFYIKAQTPEKEPFLNPIKYIRDAKEIELNNYHFFLLNIDNKISYRNLQVQTDLKKLETTTKEAKRIITETYGTIKMPEIDSKLRRYKIDIEKLEESIKLFELSEKYKIDQNKLNKLTEEIKELIFLNSSDELKIKSYQDSLKIDINIKPNSIRKLYAEFNQLLADNINKSLEDAISFRNNLVQSRREFIQDEVDSLKENIGTRLVSINRKTKERADIFKVLKAKKAITDLTEAHFTLNKIKDEAAELKSKVKILKDLNKERVQINQQINKIEADILEFEEEIADKELEFSKVFSDIYNALYPEIDDISVFDITTNLNTDAKIQFTILPNNEMLSKGRNQGRTLIYDLAVLFNSIDEKLKAPRFLIHDGILDGMDKTHFIELVKYLEEKSLQNYEFQYILTLNEEGELTDNFGDADEVNPKKIEKEAVLVLTPNKLLFDKKF